MKELSVIEIAEVSGAGLFGNIGSLVGSALGTGIDTISAIAGINPDAKTAVGTLGEGLGLIADSLLSSGVQLISKI